MAETPPTATEITTTAPLLTTHATDEPSSSTGVASTTTMLTVFLGLFAGRRGASMIVRRTAARELEAWRADWGYSLPVVSVDTIWNLVFVVVSVYMLLSTSLENPDVPVRVWISGYALQCVVHIVLVWLEYNRRNRSGVEDQTIGENRSFGYDEDGDFVMLEDSDLISDARWWENFNTKVAYMWWVVGFYWLLSAYEGLFHSAPRLFWLAVAFLCIDASLTFIGFLMGCLLGIAVCFCFPCIMAFLVIVGGRKGASESDVKVLPKYRFEACGADVEQPSVGAGRMIPIETNDQSFVVERFLLAEDADCCICLTPYEDGAELVSLPCNHHFHSTCLLKWLKMNATCPLCKYNIKRNEQV